MNRGNRLLILAICVALQPSTASAVPRDPLAKWFCAVATPTFDFATAIKSFPLERLDAPQESRRSRESDGDTVSSVDQVAEGNMWKVTYHYQANQKNVSDPYGFSLKVEPVELSTDHAKVEENRKWLRQFGKPEEGVTGLQVGGGRRLYTGGPFGFTFEVSNTFDQREASWFRRTDLAGSSAICS